jgi:hypothetical protein
MVDRFMIGGYDLKRAELLDRLAERDSLIVLKAEVKELIRLYEEEHAFMYVTEEFANKLKDLQLRTEEN